MRRLTYSPYALREGKSSVSQDSDVTREIDRVLTELQVVDPITIAREHDETGREEKEKIPL